MQSMANRTRITHVATSSGVLDGARTDREGGRMSDKDASVTVVGSYNVGLTMVVPQFPVAGETVIGRDFSGGPGGKGSNQAIAAARLGADASFVGNVGTDRYGENAVALWEDEDVDTEHVGRDPAAHTGVGFVIVEEEDGENEITVAPGANHALDAADVQAASGTVEASDCLLAQLEIRDEPIEAAVDLATEADVTVTLNPAPARELPESLLASVDYLTPNQNEARILTGREPDADVGDERIAEELLDLGVATVVMTLGSDGALVVTESETTRISAPTVPVKDTTGAGDAFNAAFTVAIGEGRDVESAARFACHAGALAVTEMEVVPGLPTRENVESMLGDGTGA
jgi:ribokinase